MRFVIGTILALTVAMASAAEAGQNFTIVLHAKPTAGGACPPTEPGLPDCSTIAPTTQVDPNADFELYLFFNNIDVDLLGWSTSLQWPADWSWLGPEAGCVSGYTAGHEPNDPGGAFDGNWSGAFDCTTGPLVLIGHATVHAGASGCLTQLNSQQESGCGPAGDGSWIIEALRCDETSTCIDATLAESQLRLGSICVGSPGVDACAPSPVAPATWGRIKASYR